jgi:hypothetical protein
MTRDRLLDALWLLLVGALSSAWCVTAGGRLGVTFDEPFYVASGLECWRTGSYKPLMSKGTMPLPVDAQTLPLHLWERRRGEPFANPYGELPRLLPVARAANLPFWWLLLFYGLRWGRVLGGPWAGRLAAGLLAADPNLLAHAALASTDIALTAMVLVAAYHWFAGRDGRWPRRVLVPGVLYGVALAAKASALAFVPILWAVFGLCHLAQAGQFPPPRCGSAWGRVKAAWAATARLRWDMGYAFWIGLAVLFIYCGSDWQTEVTFVQWAHSLPDGPARAVFVPVSEHLRIFTNAGEGLTQQVKHNVRGHSGAFLVGVWHPRAVWYYFPVALSIKLPDPTLVLLAVLLLARPRALLNPAGWAALALFAFSLNARVQIGVRLVFPLEAFLLVALAVAVFRKSPNPPPPVGAGGRRRLLAALSAICLLWSAAVAISAWPDGLRYANRLWSGPDRSAELLADSNSDWGQGLPDLKRWWEANGRPELHVWYYGADPAILLPPFRVLMAQPDHMPNPGPDALTERVGDGYLAVSDAVLHAYPDRRPEILALIDWVKTHEPVGRTPTFTVYKMR